jgi:hypothetical protein
MEIVFPTIKKYILSVLLTNKVINSNDSWEIISFGSNACSLVCLSSLSHRTWTNLFLLHQRGVNLSQTSFDEQFYSRLNDRDLTMVATTIYFFRGINPSETSERVADLYYCTSFYAGTNTFRYIFVSNTVSILIYIRTIYFFICTLCHTAGSGRKRNISWFVLEAEKLKWIIGTYEAIWSNLSLNSSYIYGI